MITPIELVWTGKRSLNFSLSICIDIRTTKMVEQSKTGEGWRKSEH